LRLQVIEQCSEKEVNSFSKEKLPSGAKSQPMIISLIEDYKSEGYSHKAVVQSKAENKETVLQGVHLVTSLFKRIILDTFHGHLDSKYLRRYQDEYVFRSSRRTS
jgi:hypothetical protein